MRTDGFHGMVAAFDGVVLRMLIDAEEALEIEIGGETLLLGDGVDIGPVRGHSRRHAVALDMFEPAANDVEGVLFELLLDAMPLNVDGLGASFGAGVDFLLHFLGRPVGLGDPGGQSAAGITVAVEKPDPFRERAARRRPSRPGRPPRRGLA